MLRSATRKLSYLHESGPQQSESVRRNGRKRRYGVVAVDQRDHLLNLLTADINLNTQAPESDENIYKLHPYTHSGKTSTPTILEAEWEDIDLNLANGANNDCCMLDDKGTTIIQTLQSKGLQSNPSIKYNDTTLRTIKSHMKAENESDFAALDVHDGVLPLERLSNSTDVLFNNNFHHIYIDHSESYGSLNRSSSMYFKPHKSSFVSLDTKADPDDYLDIDRSHILSPTSAYYRLCADISISSESNSSDIDILENSSCSTKNGGSDVYIWTSDSVEDEKY